MTGFTTLNILVEQLKVNPLTWALLTVFLYVLRSYLTATAPAIPQPRHTETIVFKDYTPVELQEYTGRQDDGMGRILMDVNGNIYDVTRGKNFYGPGTAHFSCLCQHNSMFINPSLTPSLTIVID